MDRLDALIAATWQGAALGAAAYVVCRLFPRLPARFRAWLWWAVCLKMVVVTLGAFTLPLALLPAPKIEAGLGTDAVALPPPGAAVPAEVGHPALATMPVASTFHAIDLYLFVWLVGFGILAVVLALQVASLSKILRHARPLPQGSVAEEARRLGVELGVGRRPEVRLSSEVSAPMVVRPWRPTVVLPEAFAADAEPEELRMALAHELAHLRRGDLWLALVPALAQALLWFNPIAWLAAREWATEREAACDDAALLATGGSPADYGRLLVKIVADDHRGGLAPVLGATAAYHTLKRRLQEMKTFVPHPTRAVRLGGASFAVAALLAALPWQVVAQTPEAPKENSLLTNGGFEDGLSGWKRDEMRFDARPMNAQADVDKTVFHSGKASLEFTKTEPSYNPVLIMTQKIPMATRTHRLKVSVWMKADNVHKATLGLWLGDAHEWGAYVAGSTPSDGVTHDWKRYEAIVEVPSAAPEIRLNLEMYGPGTVWIDDVTAAFVPDGTPLKAAGLPVESTDPLADVKDVPSQDLRAGNDPLKRYFLVGKPAGGPSKLLVVMPGGDGSADFNPFVRRIWKNALPLGWLIAEPVAPQWSAEQKTSIVWPTKKVRWTGMKFSTEELVEAVVKDVAAHNAIDPSKVFVLAWSSGGPAAYATTLTSPSVKGALVAMSVYQPQQLPAPSGGRDRAFYLLQSPEDTVTVYSNAVTAQKELAGGGAKVTLANYRGGHGWTDDPYGNIRKGVEWLEANSK